MKRFCFHLNIVCLCQKWLIYKFQMRQVDAETILSFIWCKLQLQIYPCMCSVLNPSRKCSKTLSMTSSESSPVQSTDSSPVIVDCQLLETAQTSSQITLPKILRSSSVVLVLYSASYHSGGRVESFFSFQAKKLSQNINMYLKWPRKTASCELSVVFF